MADLFISYAHEDEKRIEPLAKAFEKQGWTVFWDRRIPAGQTWRSYIGQALDDARCVIVAWSVHSIVSKWVVEEAEDGQKRGILVPVLLDSVEAPFGFRSLQAADLTNWQPERPSTRFKQLVQDINAVLQGAPKPSATEHVAPQKRPEPFRKIKFQALIGIALLLVISAISVTLGWYLPKSEDPFLSYYLIAVIIFCVCLWLILKYSSGETQKKTVIYFFVLTASFAILAVGWRYFEITNYIDRPEKSTRPPVGLKLGTNGLETAYEPYYIPYFLLLGTCLLITFALIIYYATDKTSNEIIKWYLGFAFFLGLCRLAWQIIDSLR